MGPETSVTIVYQECQCDNPYLPPNHLTNGSVCFARGLAHHWPTGNYGRAGEHDCRASDARIHRLGEELEGTRIAHNLRGDALAVAQEVRAELEARIAELEVENNNIQYRLALYLLVLGY